MQHPEQSQPSENLRASEEVTEGAETLSSPGEALSANEQWLQSLFTSIDEGYALYEIVFDSEGRPVDLLVREVNPAYETLMDRPAPIGKTLRELAPELDREWIDAMVSVADTGVAERFERYNATLDRWFDVYVAPAPGESDNRVIQVFHDITARKRASDELKQSEERLRLAMDAAELYLWEIDLATQSVTYSPNVEHLTGVWPRTMEEALTTVHPDDREWVARTIAEAMTQGDRVDYEVRALAAEGGYGWYRVTGKFLRDEGGDVVRATGTAQVVTAQRQATEALRAIEKRYSILFDSIDQGFCTIEVIFDESGHPVDYRFLEVNPAFSRTTGLENAVGKRMRELEPKHEAHWYAIYGRVAQTLEPIRFEAEAAALGRWYNVYAYPIGNPPEHHVAILFEDITDRRAAYALLQQSESRFRTLIQNLPDYAIFLLDPNGIITEWSEGAERIVGYTTEEAVGHHFELLFPKEAIAVELPERELDKAAVEGRVEHEGWLIRKGGAQFWGHEITTAVYDQAGILLGYTKISRDLTEREESSSPARSGLGPLSRLQPTTPFLRWMQSVGSRTGSPELRQCLGGALRKLSASRLP